MYRTVLCMATTLTFKRGVFLKMIQRDLNMEYKKMNCSEIVCALVAFFYLC